MTYGHIAYFLKKISIMFVISQKIMLTLYKIKSIMDSSTKIHIHLICLNMSV